MSIVLGGFAAPLLDGLLGSGGLSGDPSNLAHVSISIVMLLFECGNKRGLLIHFN